MSKASIPRIRKIAEECRRWADETNEKLELAYGHRLCGMCAIASAHLLTALHRAGYSSAHGVGNDGHFFVMWKGWVIDITATQFDREEVMIVKHADLAESDQVCRWSSWLIKEKCATAGDIRATQKRLRWPRGQTVWPTLARGDPSLPRIRLGLE